MISSSRNASIENYFNRKRKKDGFEESDENVLFDRESAARNNTIKTHLNKLRNKEGFDESEINVILDTVHLSLIQMSDICDGMTKNPDIGRVIEHMIQAPSFIANQVSLNKLIDCLLLIYKKTSGHKSDKLKSWLLKMIQSTLLYGRNSSNPLVLQEIGVSSSLVLKQQIKNDIEMIARYISNHNKDKKICIHSQQSQPTNKTNKYTMIKQTAMLISNMLEVVEFLPLWSSILDYFATLPEEMIDKDIVDIFSRIIEHVETGSDNSLYTVQVKIWRLHIPSLEKSVLQMIQDCSHCLTLPSILNKIISLKKLVKACSEEYQLFYIVYNILYTVIVQSNGNTRMLDIITSFLISVKQQQKQNQEIHHFHSTRFQPLTALLNNHPKDLSIQSFNQQLNLIVSTINLMEPHTSMSTREYQEFWLLLLQYKEWYYTSLWYILHINKQFISDLVTFILYYHIKECEKYKKRVVEFANILRALLCKQNLKIEDIEYAVCGLGSVEEIQPVILHVLFIFLYQSESGFKLITDICKVAGCSDTMEILSMFLYIHDIHSVTFKNWTSEKKSLYKEIISRLSLELNSDIEHYKTTQPAESDSQLNQLKSVQNMCEQLVVSID
ncbi:uncharacterized protein LOC126819295 [Patella vulgata]|uniref:uncharacterized protein LOC126819295 n=1 Tax=Patella vulgata TaxID=6465 RepID=UPI0024A7A851|nr:uncharacterized protein LOC126819295 [Patella vulgata]